MGASNLKLKPRYVINSNWKRLTLQPYKIIPPAIKSGSMYLFTTDSGTEYEVRFGRKQNNILAATIVFGVLNEEFQNEEAGEYVVVNRGEMYRVMETISAIIRLYIQEHPRMVSYEFAGENRKDEGDGVTTITARTKLFLRYVGSIFGIRWRALIKGNAVKMVRKK
jgi:hypothetical protein